MRTVNKNILSGNPEFSSNQGPFRVGADGQLWRWGERGQQTFCNSGLALEWIEKHCRGENKESAKKTVTCRAKAYFSKSSRNLGDAGYAEKQKSLRSEKPFGSSEAPPVA